MSKVSTDQKKIDWLLSHAVENVYPNREAVKERLLSGKQMTVYYGIDPTGPTLHLGHLITMRKLAELQQLGHKVILLIGDFTAMIGDPTDKAATRKQLTHDQVLDNCKLYKQQAEKVLNFTGANPVEIRFNSEWLAKMSFKDVVELASHFTVQQMSERDMFANRIKDGKPVHLHEFLYPLMQGYDSVAMDVDGEIGGNDQTFNMLAGRTLQRELKNKEKFVITNALLTDPSGKKMGKTEGNMIAMTDTAEDMYGKLMSWPDEMIIPAFKLCTDLSEEEIKSKEQAMSDGENPMSHKKELAQKIVAWLAGGEAAKHAAEQFASVHQKGEKPDQIETIALGKTEATLVDVLVESGLCSSKSDARRQIEQKGIRVNDEITDDVKASITLSDTPVLIQKGKRHFVNLTV